MIMQPAATVLHRAQSRAAAPARRYDTVLPWLPLILSALAVLFIGAFFFIGWLAIAGPGVAIDGSTSEAANLLWLCALTAMFLWAFSFGGSVIALAVVVAKGYHRSFWQSFAVVAAASPIGLVAWAVMTQ